MNDGGPAFPVITEHNSPNSSGMSLRVWLAATYNPSKEVVLEIFNYPQDMNLAMPINGDAFIKAEVMLKFRYADAMIATMEKLK